jgi:hypothetical protein
LVEFGLMLNGGHAGTGIGIALVRALLSQLE